MAAPSPHFAEEILTLQFMNVFTPRQYLGVGSLFLLLRLFGAVENAFQNTSSFTLRWFVVSTEWRVRERCQGG